MIANFAFFRSNDPLPLYLACIVGFCVGIHLFIRGFRLLQRRRLILDTPFSKIRSASMGMVEISGQAVGPYTLISPITARACYYYRTIIWELRKQGKNSQWVKIAGECMHVPFFVDDNTGRVLIDPRGAELDLHRDFEAQYCDSFFTTKAPAPPNVVAFLARHGVATREKIKVEEFCIKPKNSLFVLGTLAENPGLALTAQPIQDFEPFVASRAFSFSVSSSMSGNSVFGKSVFGSSVASDIDEDKFAAHFAATPETSGHPDLIRLSPAAAPIKTAEMTQQQKIAAALLKAGISNPAAWAAAGLTTPAAQAISNPAANAPMPSGNGNGANGSNVPGSFVQSPATPAEAFAEHPRVVLMKGTNNKTFLISWRSQLEIAKSMGWKCAAMIWGGPALSLVCLYIFVNVKYLH